MNLWLCDDWPCLGRADGVGRQKKINIGVSYLISKRKKENKQQQGVEERGVEEKKKRDTEAQKERHKCT